MGLRDLLGLRFEADLGNLGDGEVTIRREFGEGSRFEVTTPFGKLPYATLFTWLRDIPGLRRIPGSENIRVTLTGGRVPEEAVHSSVVEGHGSEEGHGSKIKRRDDFYAGAFLEYLFN